jgi:RNA polymerase sigma-70 factor (ECF subfamily)
MIQADPPTAVGDDMPPDRADGGLRLLEELRRGDPAAAAELVERYAARAYRVALAITRDAEDAEEVVQDALGEVIRNVDTFHDEAALGSWFYRIVTDAACQKGRRAAHQRAEISLEEVLPRFHEDGAPAAVIDDWSGRLDDPATRSLVRGALDAAIEELSPEYRAVVLLRDVVGLTVGEMATSMGITVANAKTRLHRARLFLRKRLAVSMAAAA